MADFPDKTTMPTRGFSLQGRLRGGLLAILLLVFLALWVAATTTIHQLVEHYLVTRLQHDADMLASQLRRHDGRWLLPPQAISPIYTQANSGHYFVIEGDGQRISSKSLAGYPLWTPESPTENPYETPAPARLDVIKQADKDAVEPVLVHFQKALVEGHPVRLYVAEDHTPIQHFLYWFDAIFAAVALLALGLTAWLTQRLVRSGFNSLRPLENQLRSHASGEKSFALPENLPQEIVPLAEALQHSLDLLNQQLQRYRTANADLAHALKTPLHSLFQQLDHLSLQEDPATLRRLQQQAERLRALVDRELTTARMAGNTWQGAAFNLDTNLSELVDAMHQLYPQKIITVKSDSGIALWPMEKEDGFELFGTLVDNACKWANENVQLTIHETADRICLLVDDDGPGVPPHERQRLINRGHRLDESQPGQGLGLAIAKELVQRYGGTLSFSSSPLGGLRVRTVLPRQKSSP